MDAVAQHVDEAWHPYRGPHGEDPGYRVKVSTVHDEWLGHFRVGTLLLAGAVGAVFLIALVNVANLLLARTVSRKKEFATRRALGASELRLVRQWLTESAVLAIGGSALGAIAAVWGLRTLTALVPSAVPAAVRVSVDAHALLLVLLLSSLTCLIFGLSPAIAQRHQLKVSPKRRASWLVTTEASLATLLLIGAGLLFKSFVMLSHVNTGFNAEHLLTMQIDLAAHRYPDDRRRIEILTAIHDHLSALPGVIAASVVSRLPVGGDAPNARGGNPFSIEGLPWNPNDAVAQVAHTQNADADYFRTLQIPLLQGRLFNDSDRLDAPRVAVVNQTLARAFFPDGALGHRIVLGAYRPETPWMTIVGVIGDVKTAGLDQETMPQFYVPLAQAAPRYVAVVLRTIGDPMKMAPQAVSVVHSVDPEQPVHDVMTMDQRISNTVSQPRLESVIVSFFAAVAVFLAAVGIFGVVAHSTARRTQEIGIRMALGADRVSVLRHVIADGMRPVVSGVAVGVAGGMASGRLIAGMLFHVKPTDPWTILVAALLLTAVALGACLIPAHHAAQLDPMTALRVE